ncbi:MAG: phospho-N-acetylmuramoyl-pentapeptide-transferase [Chlamydiia bacterium]
MLTTHFFYLDLVLALLMSGGYTALFYPAFIEWMRKNNIRSKGHVDHIIDLSTKLEKEVTPSFGGFLFIFIPFLTPPLFFSELPSTYYALLMLAISLALVGLMDDLFKVWHTAKGISARAKSIGQVASSCLFLALIGQQGGLNVWHIPFLGTASLESSSILWLFFLVFLLFVLVGTSNAVNLTDGMDGLASSLSVVSYAFLFVFALMQNEPFIAFQIASSLGGLLAFTYFNKKPARIFMGDIGSLPLGGLIAGFAILLHQEVLLIFLGGMFVVETLSVMVQVFYYKRTKKRIFACAPLHHHYQSKGWSESGIVTRFTAMQGLFALVGLTIFLLTYTHV